MAAPLNYPDRSDLPGRPGASRCRHGGARPRVLLVAPQPFFELRGTPLNVLQMVRTLCAAGHDVHLATYAIGAPVDVPGLRHHRAPPVPGIPHVPIAFSGRKIVHDVALAGTVARLLLTRRFDVVHAVEEAIFFTLPLARLRGVPVIYDLDSCISEQLAYNGNVRIGALLSLIRRLERAALRRSRLAITVCASLTETVRRMAPDTPVTQIEDCPLDDATRPPDAAAVARLRAQLNPTGAPLAVYTGNFSPYQGLDLLFDALPAMAAACPTARLLVVGGAPDEVAAHRAALAARGLGDRVVFAGRLPPEAMADVMALADALVSPRTEGGNTPLKLYTYMEAGVPIVATDLSTHRQVLDAATAVLCPPEPDAFGRALGEVLARPAAFAARAAAARERVRRDYSQAAFARRLLAAYDAVLASPERTRSAVMRSM